MRGEDEEGAEIRRAGLRVSERERRAKKVAKRGIVEEGGCIFEASVWHFHA